MLFALLRRESDDSAPDQPMIAYLIDVRRRGKVSPGRSNRSSRGRILSLLRAHRDALRRRRERGIVGAEERGWVSCAFFPRILRKGARICPSAFVLLFGCLFSRS